MALSPESADAYEVPFASYWTPISSYRCHVFRRSSMSRESRLCSTVGTIKSMLIDSRCHEVWRARIALPPFVVDRLLAFTSTSPHLMPPLRAWLCGPYNCRRHVEETGKVPRLPGPPRPPRFKALTREELRSGSWRSTNTPATIARSTSRQQAPSPDIVRSSKVSESSKPHESNKLKKSKKDKDRKHRRGTLRHKQDNPLITFRLAFGQSLPFREHKKSKKRSKSSKSDESLDLKKSKKRVKH